MELLLGSHVCEHGNRVGRLAGFELEPGTLRIRKILYSRNGEPGQAAEARPLEDVVLVHDDGTIELRSWASDAPSAGGAVAELSRATRVRRGTHDSGCLAGIEASEADRQLAAVIVRPHWWSRRVELAAPDLDFTVPGEIRTGGSQTA
jgi:hypothetical protein